MSYTIIPPCEELKDFISHFWVAEWDESVQYTDSTYYLTANSVTEFVFAFRGKSHQQEFLFSSVQGQTSHHGQFLAGNFFTMFGVSLFSYTVPFFFHLPASELNNQFMSPETLLGKQGRIVNERIAAATGTSERIQILTEFFKSQLTKPKFEDKLITKAIQYVKNQNGNLNIAVLSSDTCLSQKQFERRFKAYSGFNPKLYARIIRFEHFLKHRTRYSTLTEAACASGYYDQAHFIHEFKTFAGFSPNKFFALSGY
jgi:AraC-like DNA-binding protein